MTRRKKGLASLNANNSAILLIAITALIVMYILFLPPQDRAELLGETGSGGTGGTGSPTTPSSSLLLDANVGHVDHLSSQEEEHPLPSFRLSTKVEGTVLKEVDSLYVKSSVFDALVRNVSFRVDEELTSDVKLSFNVGDRASGRLIILLNGHRVLDADLESGVSEHVSLPSDLIERNNILTVGVSSPGWAFWRMNEFQLRTFQITGNVKDLSGAESRQVFSLGEEEASNLDRALLKFYADCEPESAGELSIRVNRRRVFEGYGDCGMLNKVELDERNLYEGENEVEFEAEQGSYIFSNMVVKTFLKDPVHPVYYFDVDDDHFKQGGEHGERCGDVDGVCPSGCDEDQDKDCCFEHGDNYWCDLETSQLDDRCVSYVSESTCGRCDSGYEDYYGRPPEACEGLCGDDKDGECPSGCSRYLDKDCCFELDDAYWCDDYPVGKPLSAVCKQGVEYDERSACPSRYYDEDGKRLSYDAEDENDGLDKLDDRYKVRMSFRFPGDEHKSATLLVNGREMGLVTYSSSWSKDISDYVVPGTNSIKIRPDTTMDITSLRVRLARD
ncbi:MAG: hypothetical protein ACLFO2_04670 [Candidatus Woesearchaeota archaeon]